MPRDIYDDHEETTPKGRDNLFLWTVFILILIGAAFACWIGSFYVFGHPEQPRAYEILKKLNKLDPPKRFEVTQAPQGDFMTAQKLFEKYSRYTRLELERENAELLRNFIKNYRETKKLVPYVRGRFTIMQSYELKPTDVFESGVVALAQSNDYPQVLLEHVYTAAPSEVPNILSNCQIGAGMSIERTYDLSAVIHIEKVPDGRMMFTVVPILYTRYGQITTFSTEPPKALNLRAGFPITKEEPLKQAVAAFMEFRRSQKGEPGQFLVGNAPPPTGPELVRLDAVPEGTKVPETGELPEMPVATPIPAGPSRPGATPPVQIAMNSQKPPSLPVATPLPAGRGEVPVATPLPMTQNGADATGASRTTANGVPLTPFIRAQRDMTLPDASGNVWRTYRPGQAPAVKVVSPDEIKALVAQGNFNQRVYLGGNFVCTAADIGSAVLRPQITGPDGSPTPDGQIRILVQYPDGFVPPAQGTTVSRNQTRPLEVREVRRAQDGQITVYVREITTPE